MNIRQKKHKAYIAKEFLSLYNPKYDLGAEEHDGDLLDLSIERLLDEAIAENIDQITYLLTLKKKLRIKKGVKEQNK